MGFGHIWVLSFGKVADLLTFIVEYNIWKKDIDLENTRKIVKKFKERMGVEIKRQEKLEMVDKQDSREGELLEKYIAKIIIESLKKSI